MRWVQNSNNLCLLLGPTSVIWETRPIFRGLNFTFVIVPYWQMNSGFFLTEESSVVSFFLCIHVVLFSSLNLWWWSLCSTAAVCFSIIILSMTFSDNAVHYIRYGVHVIKVVQAWDSKANHATPPSPPSPCLIKPGLYLCAGSTQSLRQGLRCRTVGCLHRSAITLAGSGVSMPPRVNFQQWRLWIVLSWS